MSVFFVKTKDNAGLRSSTESEECSSLLISINAVQPTANELLFMLSKYFQP